jgi:tetratricopeptide (TPR) repeat protein
MRAAAERALEIEPQLVEALAALAACEAFHEWRWTEAEARFRHVLATNPNHTIGYLWYGKLLELQGRFEEGIAAMRQGVALDPLILRSRSALGWQLCLGGHQAEGRYELNGVLELDPDNFFGLRDRAILDVADGRTAEAAEAFEAVNELGSLAHALARGGRPEDAARALTRLEDASRRGYQSPLQFAIGYLGLGDLDRMFDRLEEALAIGVVDLPSINVDPRFSELRSDARFASILTRLHLPARGGAV